MRARFRANGNEVTVVDGEPQSSAEMTRAMYDALRPFGLVEEIEEPARDSAVLAPEAPPQTVAHTDPPKRRTRRKA